MKIVLGVLVAPYRTAAQTHRRADGSPWHRKLDTDRTTADVARYLEDKYHVMEVFAASRKDMIESLVADAVRTNMANLIVGGMLLNELPMENAMEKIRHEFHEFIDHEESAGLIDGVPTRAALEGRSVRFKKGVGPRRPSFDDSGLYQSSFKCWVE